MSKNRKPCVIWNWRYLHVTDVCVEAHRVLRSELRCAHNHTHRRKRQACIPAALLKGDGIPPSPKNNTCTSITSQECFNICQNAQSVRFVEKMHGAQVKETGRYVVVWGSSALYVRLCTKIATSVRTWYVHCSSHSWSSAVLTIAGPEAEDMPC